MVDGVRSRMVDGLVTVSPRLDPDSVLAIIAGISGGGVVVHGPDVEAPAVGDVPSGTKLVVFTSGSTGAPKGVRLTMTNLEAASRASVEHLGHGPDDRWLLAMPLHHVGGLSILVRSAYAGGSVHLLPSFDPAAVASAVRDGVTILSVVPTMLLRLLDHGGLDPGPLKAVIVGGGPIPDGLLERAAEAGIPALPSYGMTETFGQVATLRPGSPPERVAHLLPGIQMRIEGDGRIAVSGEQVSPGYVGQPDRADPWLVTNDLGELEDGTLRVLGRADSMVISGGRNISPERVEAELRSHPAVGEVLVFGKPDQVWGSVVCCLYTGGAGVDELEDWLGDRLPRYMIPRVWKKVAAIPLTGPGKPDRRGAVELIG